jgi:hypothetical protein
VAVARTLWESLRTFRNQVALRMGTDVTRAPQDVRALGNANLATVAVLAKVLLDNNVITAAQLNAAAAAALGADGSVWDPETPTDHLPPA